MITVKLLGGMGNQLFQKAFGLALMHRGYKIQFDLSSLVEGTHREYSLNPFGQLPVGTPEFPVITEANLAFNPSYLMPPETCTMLGYWQSEKYFLPIADKIRSTYWKIPTAQVEWNDKILGSESVAVHVRRQDYVTLKHFHGMPEIQYYRRALALMPLNKRVFVFSDDITWCQENFPKDFEFVTGTNKYDDLWLMASCKHAVIANSSFSWWGAWLGDIQPNRLVVAPARWFADEKTEANAKDIVPGRWARI